MADSNDLRCCVIYFIVKCCYNYLVFHECKHLSLFNYIKIISTSDQGNTKYFCENFNEVETANVQPSKSFHVYSITFSKIAACQQQLTSNSVISVLWLVYQCFQNFPPKAPPLCLSYFSTTSQHKLQHILPSNYWHMVNNKIRIYKFQ